jgi:NADH-quinone oxidoreductase subunit H
MDQSLNQPWWIDVIKALVVINLVMAAFAYSTWLERKLLGRMQQRYGPNRAGPFGLLQPIADLVKLLRKESFFPANAIDLLYIAAPAVACFTALAAFSVIPFGGVWHVGDYDVTGWIANVSIGLLLIFALGAIGIYAFLVGGWASESKYSLLGSMRTAAQLVSYEVSLALSVLGVVIMGQSLSLVDIAEKQQATIWFAAPQFVGLLVFFVAGIAETNYSTAEYINMITLSGLAVTLFFGGWGGPWLPGPIWFLLKLGAFLFAFIWLRATLPRLRYDQLMRFGWKVLLPVATLNALVTAILVALA